MQKSSNLSPIFFSILYENFVHQQLKSLKYTILVFFVEIDYFSVTVESISNWFQAWIMLPLLEPDKSLRQLESQEVKWHIYYFNLLQNKIEKNNECKYLVNLYGVPEYSNSGFSNSKFYSFLKDSWRNYSYNLRWVFCFSWTIYLTDIKILSFLLWIIFWLINYHY